jgi:signal transduction histidine kinase
MTMGTDLELTVAVHGRPRALPSEMEDDLWRIAQEALTNAIRHSKGHRIRVEFQYRRRRLELIVADDGEGLADPVGASGGGFGLRGIQERVQKRRWRLSVESRPGQGTQVSVEVPLRPALPWGWA